MLEKDVISEFLFNFYTDTETINEEPTLRHTAKNTGSGLQPLDDFKSSSVYNNNISKSCDKSDISFHTQDQLLIEIVLFSSIGPSNKKIK